MFQIYFATMPTTKARMRTGSSDSAQSTGSPAPARPDCPLFMECEEDELSEAQVGVLINVCVFYAVIS